MADAADADLGSRFSAAAAAVATQSGLTRADMLQLYGFYKQATAGAAPSKSDAGSFDLKAQAKHKAWKACSALSKDEAMLRYCELAAALVGTGNIAPRAMPQFSAATSVEQSSPIAAAPPPTASAKEIVLSTEEANLCVALADRIMRALQNCVHTAFLDGGTDRSGASRPGRGLGDDVQLTGPADISGQQALPMPSAIEPQAGHMLPDNVESAPPPPHLRASCLDCLVCMRAGDEEGKT